MPDPTIDSEVGRILKHYKEYVTGVYQGVADYDEATTAHTITNLIAQEANKARISELDMFRKIEVMDISPAVVAHISRRYKILTEKGKL